ncbi:hypothetical protein OG559_21935 [Micromonospora sp. NBC_01405]|uniref:hypothetical protein n=1 Tax=Micromonospora sp. NBC_01405 TaxID=2903589 RepID=UPI00324E19C8
MRQRNSRVLGVVLTAACVITLMPGCGDGAARTSDEAVASAAVVDPRALRFKEYSYTPQQTPEALAAADFVKVTAVGTVEGFREGVTYLTEPADTPYPRVYMVVRVDRAFKGAADRSVLADGRLFVEFDRGPINTLDGKTPLNSMDVFEREVPRGTRVALFLTDAPTISNRVVNAELAPRVRTLVPHPQGLVFEDRSRSGGERLVPGLIAPQELPGPWRALSSLGELTNRMAKVRQ